MRVVIFCLVAIVLLAGLVLAIGYSLPATREGRAETVIAASPSRILDVLDSVETQPEWRADIRSVTRIPDGWTEVNQRGETITFTPEEMTESAVRLRFRSDAGYSGHWHATLTPVAEGTRISVTESATIPSPVGRIMARLFFDPEAFAEAYLAALKSRSED